MTPLSMDEYVIWQLLTAFAKEDLNDPKAVVEVDRTGDSLYGIVRSRTFAGMPEDERQLRVWKYLLDPQRRAEVPPISWIDTVAP